MKIPGETFWQKLIVFTATGFGTGLYAPFAPGTFGSIPGVCLALWSTTFPLALQVVFGLGMTVLAIPLCSVAEAVLQRKDDGRISADEWMLFPLAVIGLPLTQTWWLLPVCFVVVRIIDIVKPYPAGALQRLPAGYGIVIDDFVANIYSLGINWGIWLAYLKYFA